MPKMCAVRMLDLRRRGQ